MKTKNIFKQKDPILEEGDMIMLPKVSYKMVASIGGEAVFSGRTLPIPLVLFEYLTNNELRVFTAIFKQHREHGCCIARTKALAKSVGTTHITVANILSKLKRMGIIHYVNAGKKRDKIIDWDAIEVLDKMSEKWKPGGLIALRKKINNKNISSLQPENYRDIRAQYEISDDPIENEEYD